MKRKIADHMQRKILKDSPDEDEPKDRGRSPSSASGGEE
jgi:hypothetical protein